MPAAQKRFYVIGSKDTFRLNLTYGLSSPIILISLAYVARSLLM